MSNSSKNTMIKSSAIQQIKLNNEIAVSNPSNHTEKQSVTENVNVEIKGTQIETSMLEQKVSMSSATNTGTPKFVSAATMAVPVSEISDEELLKFALEFERTHGIP